MKGAREDVPRMSGDGGKDTAVLCKVSAYHTFELVLFHITWKMYRCHVTC